MILDLKKIRAQGKDAETFFFEYAPENKVLDMPNADLALPVKISGEITLEGRHSAYVEGEVTFTVIGECTRCLSQTEKVITVDFAEQVDDENENGYTVINDKVDLTKIVDDTIIMNTPVSFLCKEDCKGICSGCGANLNVSECKCK